MSSLVELGANYNVEIYMSATFVAAGILRNKLASHPPLASTFFASLRS